MKIKLLKKVRKRFSIIKVVEMGKHPSPIVKEGYGNIRRLPFYYYIDHNSEYTIGYAASYDTIHRELIKLIHKIYVNRVRKKYTSTTKTVWYITNK